MTKIAIAGIDAGGTKTAGMLVDLEGTIIGRSLAGPGNYQAIGVDAAEAELKRALYPLVDQAEAHGLELSAVGFGISGWDRPRDERVIRDMIERVCPDTPRAVMNDTFLILRAGSDDGVGVAIVSGTGSNTVGRGADGREYRVGGLMNELGDFGGAADIGVEAIRSARRAVDGRGRATLLLPMILEELGLEDIEDIADMFIAEFDKRGDPASLAPLIFEAANEGDRVARELLERSGDELGLSARLTAVQLFRPDQTLILVLGGSLLQKGSNPAMRDAIADGVGTIFRHLDVRILQGPPVLGGVFHAVDLLKAEGGLPADFRWPARQWQERVRAQSISH